MCGVCTHNGNQNEFDEDECQYTQDKEGSNDGDGYDPRQVVVPTSTVCPKGGQGSTN